METVDVFKNLNTQARVGSLTLNKAVGTHHVLMQEGSIGNFELVSEECPFADHDFTAFCQNGTHIGFAYLNPSNEGMLLEIELFELNQIFYAVLPKNEYSIAA